MSYIRSKTINGHSYQYIQESYREGDKVKTRHVAYLGTTGAQQGASIGSVSDTESLGTTPQTNADGQGTNRERLERLLGRTASKTEQTRFKTLRSQLQRDPTLAELDDSTPVASGPITVSQEDEPELTGGARKEFELLEQYLGATGVFEPTESGLSEIRLAAKEEQSRRFSEEAEWEAAETAKRRSDISYDLGTTLKDAVGERIKVSDGGSVYVETSKGRIRIADHALPPSYHTLMGSPVIEVGVGVQHQDADYYLEDNPSETDIAQLVKTIKRRLTRLK